MSAAASSVAVVVPVRNDAGLLARCLTALIGQTRVADEIVVADDGSGDASREIAERFGARVVTGPQGGVPATAALGYDATASDLILRLDADSVPPSTWIDRVVRRFDADPGLDALTGSAHFVGLPTPLARAAARAYLGMYFTVFSGMLGMPVLYGSDLAMLRAAWLAVSGRVHREDATMHDDLDLGIHLVLTGHRIAVDRSIEVGVSAQPLAHPIGLLRRATRAAYTVARHPQLHLTVSAWPVGTGEAADRTSSHAVGPDRAPN